MAKIDVLEILRLGAIGLGFLLAWMAYRLLAVEMKAKTPRPEILKSIREYMVFAIAIVLLAILGDVGRKLLDGGPAPKPVDFELKPYVQELRAGNTSYAREPDMVREDQLTQGEYRDLPFDLEAGNCAEAIVAVPPKTNEVSVRWDSPRPDFLKTTNNYQQSNVTVTRVCFTEPGRCGPDGVKMKLHWQMTQGSGPSRVELWLVPDLRQCTTN